MAAAIILQGALEAETQGIFVNRNEAQALLETGDVLTLEPGLYDPDGGWGVRLEDLVWLRDDGTAEVDLGPCNELECVVEVHRRTEPVPAAGPGEPPCVAFCSSQSPPPW